MSLSRRGFLFALGLALPAATVMATDADAATETRRRRKPTAAPHAPSPQAHVPPKKPTRTARAHSPRRRRHITT